MSGGAARPASSRTSVHRSSPESDATAALAARLGSRFAPLDEVPAARHRVLRIDRRLADIVPDDVGGLAMDLNLRDENEIVLRDGSTTHVRSTSRDDDDLLRDLLERRLPYSGWLR